MQVLARLEPDSLCHLLPRPLPPTSVILGIARAIAAELRSVTERHADTARLRAQLRRVLDDAAGSIEGGSDAVPGLDRQEFERLLVALQACRDFYDPTPGDFGNRIAGFVTGLRHRANEVCVDARLINLATAWAGCAVEHEALHEQLQAWKKIVSWFAAHDRGGRIPFRSHATCDDATSAAARIAALKAATCTLVPGDGAGAIQDRRKFLLAILET
jgi:hypothetical protein